MEKNKIYVIEPEKIREYLKDRIMLEKYIKLFKFKEVIQLIAMGKTAKEIGEVISKSEKSVERYTSEIEKILQCKNKAGIVSQAMWLRII